MPATIGKGATFTTTVTAGGLHALVESATISLIDRANVGTGYSLATRESIFGAIDNEILQDSSGNGLMTYDLAQARYLPGLPTAEAFTLSAFALPVSSGSLLFPSNTGVPTELILSDFSAAAGSLVVGVSMFQVAAGGKGVAITSGVARILSTGAISAGQALKVSSGGLAEAAGAAGTGFGALVFGVALSAASGGYVWANLRR